MRQLPEGTVTFLFTDIEGSTRLLAELGDAYAEALAEHRRVLRDVFERHTGVEIDTQGDSFFVAFGRATDALAAAREGQSALDDGPVRVRMGLHTGEPAVTADGYVGMDVHRAARIAAAGHGGQVLVSQTTYDLAGSPELRDLGEHRLKDLSAPERLFQLGEREFPPLRTLFQTNLPVPATSFLGRERELGEVADLLRTHRLVTLTGAGGSGKTRLGLQAAAALAEQVADGVWFVPLAALRDPALVEPTIARTLGVAEHGLTEYLRARRLVLVLDNFEQLLSAAPLLPRILEQAPGCRVVVTSRVRLRVSGEHEYPVLPLAEAEAIGLFVERAQAVDREFRADESVPSICSRLDNLPLALELAAARANVLTPKSMLARLDERLSLLTGGARDAPERQRTLRATIEWSYDLLDADERDLFAKLAIFAGGFELEAAEEVCDSSVDGLQGLVEKNLLRRQRDGRFFMLATIREFATELLQAHPEFDAVRRRQADWVLRLVREAELYGAGQAEWLLRLETELDNIRAALQTFHEIDPTSELELAGKPVRLWRRGRTREGFEALLRALAAADDAEPAAKAESTGRAAFLAYLNRDASSAVPLAERAQELALSTGDAVLIAKAKDRLGSVLGGTSEYARARPLHEAAVADLRAGDDQAQLANALHNLSDCELMLGEHEAALTHARESLALYRRSGDAISAAATLLVIGEAKVATGPGPVRDEILEAVQLHQAAGDVEGLVKCLQVAALVAVSDDRVEAAAQALGAADAVSERADAPVLLEPREQRVQELLVKDLQSRLGDGPFADARAAGRPLDVGEAIAAALG
jgi:predicted ATPase